MADNDHVSSTTLFGGEAHHYQAEPDEPEQDHYDVDDIVDLVGGAQDALDRHLAEDSEAHEFTKEEPVTLPEPVRVWDPVSVPEITEPSPEPAVPDSTSFSFVRDDIPSLIVESPEEVIAPKVEPESSHIEPEPQAEPEPEPKPAPENDALPAAEPWKAAPASAEAAAAEQPAVTEEAPAPAPASCEWLKQCIELCNM